jgi:hypothetical protein
VEQFLKAGNRYCLLFCVLYFEGLNKFNNLRDKKSPFMKIFSILFCLFFSLALSAQSSQKGVNVNNKGASVKNSKGGGVEAKKHDVSAKGSSGKGVEATNKGLDVKGSKGGMTIQKKKLEIKSKNVNVHLGK